MHNPNRPPSLLASRPLALWAQHKRNLANFKNSTFDLLSHPEATPEMIELVRASAIKMREEHLRVLKMLRTAGYTVDD